MPQVNASKICPLYTVTSGIVKKKIFDSGTCSEQSLVVHPALLLGDLGELVVDRLELLVDVRRVWQDHEAAEEGADAEDPQEEPIKHHRHDAPVLILL